MEGYLNRELLQLLIQVTGVSYEMARRIASTRGAEDLSDNALGALIMLNVDEQGRVRTTGPWPAGSDYSEVIQWMLTPEGQSWAPTATDEEFERIVAQYTPPEQFLPGAITAEHERVQEEYRKQMEQPRWAIPGYQPERPGYVQTGKGTFVGSAPMIERELTWETFQENRPLVTNPNLQGFIDRSYETVRRAFEASPEQDPRKFAKQYGYQEEFGRLSPRERGEWPSRLRPRLRRL